MLFPYYCLCLRLCCAIDVAISLQSLKHYRNLPQNFQDAMQKRRQYHLIDIRWGSGDMGLNLLHLVGVCSIS